MKKQVAVLLFLLIHVCYRYVDAFGILSLRPTRIFKTTSLFSEAQCQSPDPFVPITQWPASTGSIEIPAVITSPVLKKVYPEILKYYHIYGHPNIPLGTTEGRQCQALRKLCVQNKLTQVEIDLLGSLGFSWHSFEDVYTYSNFDEMLKRLLEYEASHPDSNFQIPKKCKEDPELGAWVTGIRRLGREGVSLDHRNRLDEVGFAWISCRKCGSKFMGQYRTLCDQVAREGRDAVLGDPNTIRWIQMQQEALKKGTLSNTRQHYMSELFGDSWTAIA